MTQQMINAFAVGAVASAVAVVVVVAGLWWRPMKNEFHATQSTRLRRRRKEEKRSNRLSVCMIKHTSDILCDNEHYTRTRSTSVEANVLYCAFGGLQFRGVIHHWFGGNIQECDGSKRSLRTTHLKCILNWFPLKREFIFTDYSILMLNTLYSMKCYMPISTPKYCGQWCTSSGRHLTPPRAQWHKISITLSACNASIAKTHFGCTAAAQPQCQLRYHCVCGNRFCGSRTRLCDHRHHRNHRQSSSNAGAQP